MKTVIYFDQELEVEEDHNYIATDDDGDIYSYVKLPRARATSWGQSGGEYTNIGTRTGNQWRKSLRCVAELPTEFLAIAPTPQTWKFTTGQDVYFPEVFADVSRANPIVICRATDAGRIRVPAIEAVEPSEDCPFGKEAVAAILYNELIFVAVHRTLPKSCLIDYAVIDEDSLDFFVVLLDRNKDLQPLLSRLKRVKRTTGITRTFEVSYPSK